MAATDTTDSDTPVLEARDIVKTFPGVSLSVVSVAATLRRGEVHALVGENGAGKSTLMNILAGVYQPDEGQILWHGQPVVMANPQQARERGVGVVFQELSLAPNLSVAENIFANRQPLRGCLDLIDWARLHEQTRDLLALFDLRIDPAELLGNLPVAQQQAVEILKALSTNPQVLILDEPTSSLTSVETRLLFENIRRLKKSATSFIYISHHLQEVFEIADRMTVLRDGQFVETCTAGSITEEDLVRKMVGRELRNVYGQRTTPLGPPCFRVENAVPRASRPHAGGTPAVRRFGGVSFALREGEIVGLAGLVGAGRTELGRALFGAEPLESGAVFIAEERVRLRSPAEAIRHRLGYQTEDRKQQGLFLRLGVAANCVAPSLRSFSNRLGLLHEGGLREFAERSRARFRIVCSGLDQPVGNLSGGNQQKVLLASWVGIGPKVLIVDEPTRGVDVGARSEIYALLRELAAGGVGIILISSDLQEILGLSDRVVVMRNGELVAEFPREQATEENIIAAAAGVTGDVPGSAGVPPADVVAR
ncbi:MAG: sugar ABC transporter ATP-binding protein [Planctomycetota bacterium]